MTISILKIGISEQYIKRFRSEFVLYCSGRKAKGMRLRRLGALLSIPLILVACATAQDVANRYYADERYAPVSPEIVKVLTAPPKEPYEVIAEFQSRRESPLDIRNKAAAIGADAVIITLYGGTHSLTSEWAQDDRDMNKTFTRIIGIAIKMKEKK